jgi:putative two-component system response regulator
MSRLRHILVVDDLAPNRQLLCGLVESLGYSAEPAASGLEALAKLPLEIDLVLLDVMMPDMDGFEVLRRMRAHALFHDLPVIMVTALDSREDRVRSVAAGANDFIAKPVDKTELKIRIASQLRLKDAQEEIRRHNSELEAKVDERTQVLRETLAEMVRAQKQTYEAQLDCIQRLVLAAEFKDRDTAAHISRIGSYIVLLAEALHLPPGEVEILKHASPLHDVGKIGIPDAILLKKGPLTAEERRVMCMHTTIGAEILADSPSEVLRAGQIIALSHHEKWDGTGYPQGLAGEAIPLWGRLCAVVDAFDALTSNRPYRSASSGEEALEMMRESRGTSFEPRLFDLFESIFPEIEALRRVLHVPDELSG